MEEDCNSRHAIGSDSTASVSNDTASFSSIKAGSGNKSESDSFFSGKEGLARNSGFNSPGENPLASGLWKVASQGGEEIVADVPNLTLTTNPPVAKWSYRNRSRLDKGMDDCAAAVFTGPPQYQLSWASPAFLPYLKLSEKLIPGEASPQEIYLNSKDSWTSEDLGEAICRFTSQVVVCGARLAGGVVSGEFEHQRYIFYVSCFSTPMIVGAAPAGSLGSEPVGSGSDLDSVVVRGLEHLDQPVFQYGSGQETAGGRSHSAMAAGNQSVASDSVDTIKLPREVIVIIHNLTSLTLKLSEFVSDIPSMLDLSEISDDINGFCHDIKNPVTVLISQADILSRKAKKQAECLTCIQSAEVLGRQARKIQFMVKRLAEHGLFNRAKVGGDRCSAHKMELANLCDIANTAVRYVQDLSGERRIIQDLPPYLPGIWDCEGIQQVLINLLENAIKYSPLNTAVCLRINLPDNIDNTVEITVEDKGIGIPVSEMNSIFNKYFRCCNAVATGKEGAGFGLFIVRKVVNAHKGDIRVTSREGEGTIFTIRLPIFQESIVETD